MVYRLYIGSNNKTKKLEKEKALKIINKFFDGCTYYEATGLWKGEKEKTLIVEIETKEKEKIKKTIKELLTGLNQEAIGLIKTSSMQFIS